MNRLFRKFLLTSTSIYILCAISSLQSIAQTLEIEGEKIDYIMPSAEAAALIKSAERPASLANGILDISIPLCSIPKTPISLKLNYNASGLMANELPSTAGLGWRLEAGGMITRVVVGIPDDYATGYLNRSSSIDGLSSKLLNQYSGINIYAIQSNGTNSYDDSPDIFYYDILGQKGKFVLDRNNEALCFPRNNLKISYKKNSTNRIDSIFVKLPDGVIINFTNNETCTVSGYAPINSSFTSSWSISTIESKDQVIALFEYNENQQGYTYNNLKAEEVKVLNSPNTQFNRVLKYNVQYTSKLLTTIKTYDTEVLFSYNTSQINFGTISTSDWNSLRDVNVSFINHNNGPTIYYKYIFCYNNTGTPPFGRNKFELSKFSITAPGVELPYKFEYFDGNLPTIGTTSIDLWGYYNGALNGGTIIPSIYNVNGQLTPIPLTSQTPLYNGANRSSNLIATRIGTLRSILSPEGLKTEYDYELNSFSLNGLVVNGGGLRIKSIYKYDETNLIHQENYSYLPENPEQQTSGVLLYHTAPAIGMRYENMPLSQSNFSYFEVYTKTSYNGYGSIPYLKPVYYTNVSVSNGNTGSVSYKFGLPVDKSESGILPSDLSWANSGNNANIFGNEYNRWSLYNETDTLVPSIFHLWTTPLLKSVTVKKQSGITVKTTNYIYGPLKKHRMVSSLKLLPRFIYSSGNNVGDILISHDEGGDQIVDDLPLSMIYSHSSKSYILSAWRELLSQIDTVYNPLGEGGVSNSKYYEYAYPEDGFNYSLVKQVKSIDVEGESITKRFKYSFDPDFDFNSDYDSTLAKLSEELDQCIRNNRTNEPTRIDTLVSEVSDCHQVYNQKIASTSISSEVGAIKLLKNQGNYSTPIETTTVHEKNGVETVVSGEFSIYEIQAGNKVILPIKDFYLKRPVPKDLFKGLKVSNNFTLDFDSDYELTGTITKYNSHGQILERLTKDGVYTSYLYDDESDSPNLEAVNCRYETIVNIKPRDIDIDEASIRNATPNAMITTHKYLFPIGEYKTTDYRERTTYTIYNSLGEVIGKKDHDKNLRAVNIRKRKLQVGTPTVVLATEPNGDAKLNTQAVSSESNISIYSNGGDMSRPVGFRINCNPAYTYTVSYDGFTTEETITTNEFYHKFYTDGSHIVSVKSYDNGRIVENSEKTFTLERKPMTVSYTAKSIIDGNLVNNFSVSSSMLHLYSTMYGGTGEYTVRWSINYTPEGSVQAENRTETRLYSESGSVDTFTNAANGTYNVDVTISDGNQTFTKRWHFIITNGLAISVNE